jgi:hypothetical protein
MWRVGYPPRVRGDAPAPAVTSPPSFRNDLTVTELAAPARTIDAPRRRR